MKRLKKTLKKHKAGFGIFHCCSVYPSNQKEIRLTNINYLIKKLNLLTGFSDHTIGKNSSGRARELGATFFERHFTLDRTFKGTDHAASLEPDGFRRFVRNLKEASSSLKSWDGNLSNEELMQRKKLKRVTDE